MHNEEISTDGGGIVVSTLLANGVDTVFALPGIQLDPLFDAMYREQESLRVIVPRHEQATTYMADGYARSTGRPGVAIVVPGPGMLNALAGLSTAYACNSPVLLIAGQIRSDQIGLGHGLLHELRDQTKVAEGVVKWVARPQSVEEIGEVLTSALRYLATPGAGPAVVELPADLIAQKVSYEPIRELPTAVAERSGWMTGVPDVIETVASARAPMIWVGGGARHRATRDAVAELAEYLGAPVVMSESGKGVLPSDHPLAFERVAANIIRQDSDLAIVVGSRLRSSTTGGLLKTPDRVVRIDIDENVADEFGEAGTALIGNAEEIVPRLLTELHARDDVAARENTRDIPGYHAEVELLLQQISPQRSYLEIINRELSEDSILVAEFTQLGYTANICYPVLAPEKFIWPGYQGTLGYGFATALGAAVAGVGRVLCISGDGGFSWTLSELSTAKKYQIPLITVVVNDGYYGNVRRIQREDYGERYIGTELTNPDYQKLAEAFGIPSFVSHDPVSFAEALRNALAESGPSLIELRVGDFPSPWVLPLGL